MRLVYQINVPNYNQQTKPSSYTYNADMYQISERNARRYAEKCQADYYLITKATDYQLAAGKHLDFQKLKAYEFDKYDQIIYMDCDLIIKNNAPDLFELCQDNFSVCSDNGKGIKELSDELGIPEDYYFNAGLMYLTRDVLDQTRPKLEEYLKEDYTLDGQGLLNKLFYDSAIYPNRLDPNDWNPVRSTFGRYVDHYTGNKKKRWGEVDYGV